MKTERRKPSRQVELRELKNAHKLDLLSLIKRTSLIQHPSLHDVGHGFQRNVLAVNDLLSLPSYLMLYFLAWRAGSLGAVKEVVTVFMAQIAKQPQSLDQMLKETRERHQKEVKIDLEEAYRRLGEVLGPMGRGKFHGSILRPLILGAISNCWTAFETLAADAWEVLVNSRSAELAQSTIGALPPGAESLDLSRRQVSVGFLAKYDLNLKGKLGSVLRSKFDFTRVQGIREAYRPIFQKDVLGSAADPSKLAILEATRHLIVHRAGIVDEEFKRRTGSRARVGSPLRLQGDTAQQLIGSAIEAGCRLLEACDDWVRKGRPATATSPAPTGSPG